MGTKFLNIIGQYYKDRGFEFGIVTSAKNMIHALRRSDKWVMIRYSKSDCVSVKSKINYMAKTNRNACRTAGFRYV